MTKPKESRADRLQRLYGLRERIDQEIAEIEVAIESDGQAMARARASARSAGVKIRKNRALCGTDSGYYKHRRKNPPEPACAACRLAHAAAERRRKENTADAGGTDDSRGGRAVPGDAQ